ncbi:hypothetical protein GC163_21160 [bacterium]|nr:hypothetical protein [bacterium]
MERDSKGSRSELDDLAIQMETAVDRFIGDQNASRGFVVVRFATDESAGHYPQAAIDGPQVYLEDDGDPFYDRCPRSLREPVKLKLRRAAKWTDALSSDLWSDGFLLSAPVLAVFSRFPLGVVQQYKAEVSRGKDRRAYTYVFFANHVTHADIDFERSEFYIADMIGSPQRLVDIASAEDFDRKRQLVCDGELDGCRPFSRLEFKNVRLLPGRTPQAAVFGLGKFSTQLYVRRDLYEALRDAAVTGLDFKRNNRLFTD